MNILALDSATEACSAALLRDDGEVFGRFQLAPRQHVRLLPQMIQELLDDAGLERIQLNFCAFSNGPGAFTGIRIAAAQAQGIGIGLGIPLVPVSTLAVLAQTALDRHPWPGVVAALDARMQEIYWGAYQRDDDGLAQLVGEERLGSPAELGAVTDIAAGAGHGWLDELCADSSFPIEQSLLPNALSMLALASKAIADNGACKPGDIRINYLRNRVAEKART